MEQLQFYDALHQQFYKEHTEGKNIDCYNRCVIYLLALTKDTRKHYNDIYNEDAKEINIEVLQEAWQTSGSLAICRLAFNLFNSFTGIEDAEAKDYTIANIFQHRVFAQYYYQAIKIRFEVIEE